MSAIQKAILVDITRCIACRSCVVACDEIHGFPGDGTETELSARNYTALAEIGGLPVRKLCRHCLKPSCVSVCPVAALRKTESGAVVYDGGRCIGCRYCILACPFNVPRYEWNEVVPYVRKCDMCADRVAEGGMPACAEACPTGATEFGDRDSLIAEAHRRIDASPGEYFPHVYGEHEIGGTSVLFLSPVSFAGLGFPGALGEEPLPMLTKKAIQKIPGIVLVGGSALLAVWWITHRRELVALAEAAKRFEREERKRRKPRERNDATH